MPNPLITQVSTKRRFIELCRETDGEIELACPGLMPKLRRGTVREHLAISDPLMVTNSTDQWYARVQLGHAGSLIVS